MYKWIIFVILRAHFAVDASEPVQDDESQNYYFGYGSNISGEFFQERLKDGEWTEDGWRKTGTLREPIPIDLGSYELHDYEFSYSLHCKPFGGEGTAGNIHPKEGTKVYGAVYKIAGIHLTQLDTTEFYPVAYTRMLVNVHKYPDQIASQDSPETLTVWVYVANPEYVVHEENPHPNYVNLLVEAAKKRLFPPEYIEKYLDHKHPGSCH